MGGNDPAGAGGYRVRGACRRAGRIGQRFRRRCRQGGQVSVGQYGAGSRQGFRRRAGPGGDVFAPGQGGSRGLRPGDAGRGLSVSGDEDDRHHADVQNRGCGHPASGRQPCVGLPGRAGRCAVVAVCVRGYCRDDVFHWRVDRGGSGRSGRGGQVM